jgi:glycine betaine transporter
VGSGLLFASGSRLLIINNPPVETANNKVTALQYTFHWGFTPWAMYSLFGLIVAYNLIKKIPNLLDAILPY